MAATGLQLNWTSVGFTPTAGSLTTFTRVTGVSIDPGGSLLGFSGDNDRFPVVFANAMNTPTITISGGNIAQFQGFSPGAVGTVVATHKDAKGGSNGDIVYTGVNATVANVPASGSHGQYGSGSITFQLYSSDGQTNPISFTRA